MIAVIADDFTGAAEIGGIGIRHGFKVVIDTQVSADTQTDILVIATDTRSQSPEDAQQHIEKITGELLALKPDLIYKKIDSILRGNVAEELMAQLRASSQNRALLIPANPGLRRIIREGIYYYNEIPLNEFDFTNGTSHKKRNSSHVLDLIGEKARPITSVVSCDDDLPSTGLLIGNTSDSADLLGWAERVNSETLPAGGAGFFDAILSNLPGSGLHPTLPLDLGKKKVYVCGSAFAKSRELVQAARDSGHPVLYMPVDLFQGNLYESLFAKWTEDIIDCLQTRGMVILAVDEVNADGIDDLSSKIKVAIATTVDITMSCSGIDELIVEGGATAHSIIQKLGYTKFYPTQELGPGTIRMKVEEKNDIFLTLKPGSYLWPKAIWQY